MGTARAKGPAARAFTPTTRPAASASGPPELTGARRRSACIHEGPRRSIGPTAQTIPVASAPRTPNGWPTAATNDPIRMLSDSATDADGRPVPGTPSSARSASESRASTRAWTHRPSTSRRVTSGRRTTCAFVTTKPGGHSTPDPRSSPASVTSTVTRRSCSARAAMSITAFMALPSSAHLGAPRALADGHRQVSRLAAAKDRRGDALADAIRPEGRLEIGRIGDAMGAERDDHVADREARRGGRAARLHLDDDHRGLLIEREALAQLFRQTHGLGAHAQVRARNSAAAQQLVDDTIHRRRGNGEMPVPRGARGVDADDAALHVDQRSAGEARIEREVEVE